MLVFPSPDLYSLLSSFQLGFLSYILPTVFAESDSDHQLAIQLPLPRLCTTFHYHWGPPPLDCSSEIALSWTHITSFMTQWWITLFFFFLIQPLYLKSSKPQYQAILFISLFLPGESPQVLGWNTAHRPLTIEKFNPFMWLSTYIPQKHFKVNRLMQEFLCSSEPKPKPVSLKLAKWLCHSLANGQSWRQPEVPLHPLFGDITTSNKAANADTPLQPSSSLSTSPILLKHLLSKYSNDSWWLIPCLSLMWHCLLQSEGI